MEEGSGDRRGKRQSGSPALMLYLLGTYYVPGTAPDT